MEILNRDRLRKAKAAFSTRRVPKETNKTLITTGVTPKPGDLVLAKVTALGSHKNVELPSGRKAFLVEGDEIILAYGNRYAPDQYEAYVPNTLEPCHLVAAGGLAGIAQCWHDKMSGPTQIEPAGLLGCANGKVINIGNFALASIEHAVPQNVFAVFGTSMNAGKTTTAAGLVNGLSRTGCKVGVAKITGTGAGNDLWMMRDYGASVALDFTDAGYPSTFGANPELVMQSAVNLMRHLAKSGCDTVVLEIADGLYQAETAAIAASANFRSLLTGVFFAAGDAMGAVSGARRLIDLGHNLLGVSGAMTRSPLAIRETLACVNSPVFTLADLMSPEIALTWLPAVEPKSLRMIAGA